VAKHWSSSLKTRDNPNPPPLSCYLLQLGGLLEWIKRAGEFSDESTTCEEKRFEPRCPTSKEDLLALTALRLDGCNLTGNQRRETNTPVLVFRLLLHSESGQFFQLRAHEHCLLPPVAPACTSASIFYKSFFLTGAIPESLGKCTKLTFLRLDSNQLTGKYSIHHALLPRKVTCDFC
jgi:hypothetical protein